MSPKGAEAVLLGLRFSSAHHEKSRRAEHHSVAADLLVGAAASICFANPLARRRPTRAKCGFVPLSYCAMR
jgi:hypothetical protein